MSEYYNEEYKNYYNKLSSSKETSKVKYMSEESVNKLKTIKGQITSSGWTELALEKISDGIITNIENDTKVLDSNISSALVIARDLSYNDLLPKLEKLKEKDEEYETLLKTIKTEGSTAEYESQKKALENTLKTYQEDVDKSITNIKNLNEIVKTGNVTGHPVYMINNKKIIYEKDETGRLVKLEAVSDVTSTAESTKTSSGSSAKQVSQSTSAATTTSSTSTKIEPTKISTETKKDDKKETTTSSSSSEETSEGNVKHIELLGGRWKVADTKMSLTDYASEVASKKICQTNDTSKYGDYCLAFSYVHASNLKNGNVDSAEAAGHYAHAGEFYTFVNDDKQVVLNKIYEEINKGNPVILQVNGNSKGTVRHFVTVVGYSEGRTSGNDLLEKELLILDSWDGQIERMDTSSSRFMTTGKSCGKTDYSGYRLQVMKE